MRERQRERETESDRVRERQRERQREGEKERERERERGKREILGRDEKSKGTSQGKCFPFLYQLTISFLIVTISSSNISHFCPNYHTAFVEKNI